MESLFAQNITIAVAVVVGVVLTLVVNRVINNRKIKFVLPAGTDTVFQYKGAVSTKPGTSPVRYHLFKESNGWWPREFRVWHLPDLALKGFSQEKVRYGLRYKIGFDGLARLD